MRKQTKYKVMLSDSPCCEYDTKEEAEEHAREFQNEILSGVYDEEWHIGPKDRQELADDVSVTNIEVCW